MAARLSAGDSLALHTQTPTTPAHTVALVILDPSAELDHERLRSWVASSLPRVGLFRSRLVPKPLGVGQPLWAEIENYDPAGQIHSVTLPLPGDDRALMNLMTQLTGSSRGSSRPLWEAWTIGGLPSGRWALAVRISPLLGTTLMWDRLFNDQPKSAGPMPPEPGPGSTPSLVDLVVDALSEIAESQVTGLRVMTYAVADAAAVVRRRLRGDAQQSPADGSTAPQMSGQAAGAIFGAPVSGRRSIGLASVSRADVQTISDAFGCNTANVLLAACAMSLRRWLRQQGEQLDEPLLFEIPLSAPGGDPADGRDSEVLGRVHFPVGLDDPVQILSFLHTASERQNIARSVAYEKGRRTDDLATAVGLFPPWITHLGTAVLDVLGLTGRPSQRCHGSVSFVSEASGHCAGADVVGRYLARPLSAMGGLNFTVTAHSAVMDVCVNVCPDNISRVDDIACGVADAVDLLVRYAAESPRGQGRSVVSEMLSYSRKQR